MGMNSAPNPRPTMATRTLFAGMKTERLSWKDPAALGRERRENSGVKCECQRGTPTWNARLPIRSGHRPTEWRGVNVESRKAVIQRAAAMLGGIDWGVFLSRRAATPFRRL